MKRCVIVMAPVLALALVLAVAFHRLIESPSSLIVDGKRPNIDHAYRKPVSELGNDLTSVFLPRFLYVVSQNRSSGHMPAWDTLGFGGRPLIGNPQAGWLYPPVWLAWRVGVPGALGWLTVGHLLLGGLGAYRLARLHGLGRFSAVMSGVCYEASPYLLAHTFEGHYPHVWSACWYPWAFWALIQCLRGDRLGYWTLPAILALTFLTGHPQEWYYLVIVGSIWVGVESLRAWKRYGVAEARRPLLVWGGLLALSLSLCAADLIPQLLAGVWSLKAGSFPLTQINRYRLHSLNIAQLLSPTALGGPHSYFGEDNYWETVLSLGFVPLVLACVGFAKHPDRSLARRWGWLTLGAIVFAAGKQLGLYSVLFAILPGMERFRVPARTLFLASLGGAVLAGAGVDWLVIASRESSEGVRAVLRVIRDAVIAIGLGVGLGGVLVALVRSSPGFKGLEALSAIALSPGFEIAVFGMLAVTTFGSTERRRGDYSAWGLGGVAAIELAYYGQALLVCAPTQAFVGNDPIGRVIRTAEGDEEKPVRLASFGTVYPDLNAAALGLEKTNVNDGFQIQHAADLYQRLYPLLDPARPVRPGQAAMDEVVESHKGAVAQAVLDLMGVRYLISDRPLPLPNFERLEPAEGPAGGLWINRTALPRAYVVPRARARRDHGAGRRRRLHDFDPRTGVIMDADPIGAQDNPRQTFTPATLISTDPDEVVMRVSTEAPGLLVVGSTWMPGWTATVDGRREVVERGNNWQQVVAIREAGAHQVVLRYTPPGLVAGSALTAGALGVWVGMGLIFAALRCGVPVWRWTRVPVVRPAFSAYRSAGAGVSGL